ncbi:CO2 hydration protein [Gloeobacter kilaueensis]|uniref:CO2 hydration protein n=1 Tax=Gloeobacter kilaueensis (strain ATCC BAA-2537 / CCAP 1431/1 / ULC 316 / JS1) TaxID=1183438 RepID=U5QC28_GLOK1|nr:CO2 hydration protein [Gloeobacter kilaueensis]AGY56368.1 CO2 hydration protein [Gloeobacter kilaueensis JS1]
MENLSFANLSLAALKQLLSQRLEAGGLLSHSDDNLLEVVGILGSYGIVLDGYSRNLIYIAEHQFLVSLSPFKYFNGKVTFKKLVDHSLHHRLNYEYAEYCARTLYWHGNQKLNDYLQGPEFGGRAERAIRAKFHNNPAALALHKVFPITLPEQVRKLCYYHILGQFWRVMSSIFLSLAERYDQGQIQSIPDVVTHIANGLGKAADQPLTYSVPIDGKTYELIPAEAELRWVSEAAVPYVEIVFFRAIPFRGTVSYTSDAAQIPAERDAFSYGVLYADPLRVGAAGVTPMLLMQDLHRFLPDFLRRHYREDTRSREAINIDMNKTFQKSMFCVTNAAVLALAPLSAGGPESAELRRAYFDTWAQRIVPTKLAEIEP